MPNPSLENLSFGPELAGVPHLDQYWGLWALHEPYAQFLRSHAQNINLQLHLEQHAAAGDGGRRGNGLYVDDDGIALFELTGTLMKHQSSMAAGTSTALARRQVRAAMRNDDVRGGFLYIDSPGGTFAGTEDLAADLRAFARKKPLFAYIEDLGASAGYWLATPAQRVSINSTGYAGSIGVFQVVEDFSKQAEQKGVTVHVVRFGAMKGLGTPGAPVTEEQLAYLQERIDAAGEDFLATIMAGRKLTREQALALADGRVHKGAAAKTLGLVDAVESIDEAYAALLAETKKPRSPARTKVMSTESTSATDTNQPKAATLAELKEACPGASSEFILDQLEKNATVIGAIKAHTKALADEKAQLAKENAELKAKAEAPKADAKPKRGNEPIGGDAKEEDATGGNVWDDLGANLFMTTERDKLVASGVPTAKAAARVFEKNPGLREAMVAEANK